MTFMKLIALTLLILIISIIFTGCNAMSDNKDVEVHIIRVFKTKDLGGSVNVRYQIENIGESNVKGWNIYFRVSMQSGKQVEASDGRTYYVFRGGISEVRIATGKIPDHYDDLDIPTVAVLQKIHVY